LKLTRRHKTLAAAAGAGLAGSIALAFALPALAADYKTIPINQGNVPTTAEDFSDRSCDQIPGDTADWLDGWVFVLPESVPAEGNFKYIEAVFTDEDGNVLRYNTDDDGGIVSGSGDNKAYIITPAGLTLIDADAQVDLDEMKPKYKFNLTHTCPATEDEPGEETTTPAEEPSSPGEETTSPAEEPSSPGEETTTPAEEPSSPGEETTTPVEEPSSPGEETTTPAEEPSSPDEETTSPAEEPSSPGEETTTPGEATTSPGEQTSSPAASTSAPHQPSTTPVASLPTTGSPLIWVLAAAGALLLAGAVILVFMSRRSSTEEA
jgi:hypothetical protein